MILELLGDCRNESLVESIFGSVSEFAQQVEQKGDNFTLNNYLIKYNEKKDLHTFFKY